MNDAQYVTAYAEWQKSIPFTPETHKDFKRLTAAMHEASSPEHEVSVEEVSYMSDQAICACGWKSAKFWDGADYAMKQWREHVMNVVAGDYDLGCGCG